MKKLDDSYLGTIFINRVPDRHLYLTSDDNLFNLTFSDDDILINDLDEINVNVTLNTGIRVVPDDYDFKIFYNFDNEPRITRDVDVQLQEFQNFSVSIKNCTKEMPILSHGVFCDFNIENTGNIMTDLEVYMDGF
jgi:hypothetical protein